MTRQTGIKVHMIDREKLGFYKDSALVSGVIYNPEGHMRTINTEGVTDNGMHNEEFSDAFAVYTWTGYKEFSRTEIEAALTGTTVDLSTFIRVFGDRLERNFYYAYSWATGKTEGR